MLSRRRFIAVAAAAAALAGTPARARPQPVVWQGIALGAPARIVLHHPDRRRARQVLGACLAEIERLEAALSLYRDDSALARLNRDGELKAPPLDLVAVLGRARHFSELSGGAFDVTVQPLWRLYATHFSSPGADPAGPPAALVEAARARVGYRGLEVAPARVAFRRPGMAATLNGIGQGYVTDRVAELLGRAGFLRVLAALGEIRALAPPPDGPWRVGIAGSTRVLRLDKGAIATSAPSGLRFSPACHHIFDPASGRSAADRGSVTVVAADATTADALSTALAVLPPDRGALLAAQVPDVRVIRSV